MNKIFLISMVVVTLIFFSVDSAYATNYTKTIFADTPRSSNSNTYVDENHTFSIQPPLNWIVLKNLPSSVSKNALAVFSNNDKSQYATFGIYHRPIGQNVIDALNSHSDKDILATIAQEMQAVGQSEDSKTIVYNGFVDRYSDGIRVAVRSATQYTADNSTSMSENIIYFLNNGNQYTLDLTTDLNSIDKNSQLFEDSVSTFLVNQINPVPEFPTAFIILITAIFVVIIISRSIKSKNNRITDFR